MKKNLSLLALLCLTVTLTSCLDFTLPPTSPNNVDVDIDINNRGNNDDEDTIVTPSPTPSPSPSPSPTN